MFCPNCSQAFSSNAGSCPTCGFWLGSAAPVRADAKPLIEAQPRSKEEESLMHAGVLRGVKLMLIAVACLPIFKVLLWLYPQKDFLVPGTQSVDLFERAGTAILVVLFGGGILRAAYALTVERKRDARMLSEQG